MRTIHPVAAHEKFVASGTYLFYQQDVLLDQREHWTIHELPDGSQFVRVDDERRVDAAPAYTLTETLLTADGKVERCEIHHFSHVERKLQKVRINFAVYTGYVQLSHRVNQQPAELREITLSPETVIYPQAHVFWGAILQSVEAAAGGTAPLYWISHAIFPAAVQVHAQQMGTGVYAVGLTAYESRHYQFNDADGQGHANCWLDTHGMLLAKDTDLKLTQYARRPEPKKS